MKATFEIARHGMRLAALALVLAGVSSAQMGGGMMGGSYSGSGYGGMMGGSYSGSGYGGMMGGNYSGSRYGGMMGGGYGMMGGSLTGMMGGSFASMTGNGSGLAVGTDGTLYLIRGVAPQAQGQVPQPGTTQLSAIDSNGNPRWTLPINSTSASQPALGKDGTLFVTTSDLSNWMYNRNTQADGITPSLLIVKPAETTASIVATVPLAGQIASAPQIVADNAGGYVVYVTTADMFNTTGSNTVATASRSYLYAFSPAGDLKYRLQLNEASFQ
ncbi:MAG: hypothetical protein ACE14L_18070 [Terriglobales bacterium]